MPHSFKYIFKIENGLAFILTVIIFSISSCRKDQGTPSYEGYPKEIGELLIGKCAVSGCHNSASANACAGLDLSSWETLFKGSNNNSSVVPYRSDQSFLLFSVNTFDDIGPKLNPTMPVNRPSLSRYDVVKIQNWINEGAPNNFGFVKFSDDPNRKKIYVANQGCDLVTVFDAKTKLVMRVFDVGNSGNTEAPHDLIVSPDGQYVYVSFYASNLFQKYRTSDQQKVGELTLMDYSWHSIDISGDSKMAITTHLSSDGKITLINLSEMKIIATYIGMGFINPHGCLLNYNGSMAYVTSQQGNFIYKIDLTDPLNPATTQIPLEPGQAPATNGIYKPYSIAFFPDHSKYAVTCQGTNEVRVFNTSNDSLLKTIKSSGVPQLMSFSKKNPYLFVSCMEDSANAQTASRVDIINYNSLQVVSSIFTGYQPRGITADDDNNCVWVANRNISSVGWAPHHTTACGGRNGYITIIDMSTLQLIPNWKTEVSVDPYCISINN